MIAECHSDIRVSGPINSCSTSSPLEGFLPDQSHPLVAVDKANSFLVTQIVNVNICLDADESYPIYSYP